MRFRQPLFVLAVGTMVLAVPSDRGPLEQVDTVAGPNAVPTGAACSVAVRQVPANAQRSSARLVRVLTFPGQ